MRIAMLLNLADPWARDLALGLAQLGHQVHLVDYASWSVESYHRVKDAKHDFQDLLKHSASLNLIRSSAPYPLNYVTSRRTLRKFLQRHAVEVLLAMYGGGLALAAFASGFRPYAVYAVGSDVLQLQGIRRQLVRLSFRGAAEVFANGAYLAQRARELVPDANIRPLYLGIDAETFSPRALPDSPVRIICTRGFMPLYNNEYLIHGLALLSHVTTDYRLTFVSGGPTLESVKRLADEILPSQVRARIEFLGGVPRERLIQMVRNSQIFVSMSRSDGTSISLLEALASGLFPVLSDIPANREWISSDKNGLLVPLDKPDMLARALADAMSAPRWQQAALHNRTLVLERANRAQNIKSLASFLEAHKRYS